MALNSGKVSDSSSVAAAKAEGVLEYNNLSCDVVHVVFMIDNSASMKAMDVKEANGSRSCRYRAVQQCIGKMLNDQKELSFASGEEANKDFFASFVVFDDVVRLKAGPLSLADAIAYLNTALSKVIPKWGGKYGAAMAGMGEVLASRHEAKQWQHIGVLLTDGRPGDRHAHYASMGKALLQKYRIDFQCISFGSEGTQALERLSKELEGHMHKSGFAQDELAATFEAVSTKCSTLRSSGGDGVSLRLRSDVVRETSDAWKGDASSCASEKRGAWVFTTDATSPSGYQAKYIEMRIHKAAFAEGGLRVVHHAFFGLEGGKERHLVMKRSKFEQDGSVKVDAFHRQFLDTHKTAWNVAFIYAKRKAEAFQNVVSKLENLDPASLAELSKSCADKACREVLEEALTAIAGADISTSIPSKVVNTVVWLAKYGDETIRRMARELIAAVQSPKPGSGAVCFVPSLVAALYKKRLNVNPEKPPDLTKPQKSYDFYTVETYIEGKYTKLNDNNGWVNYDVPFELMNEAAAFSHFTYEHFEGKSIIVDIQGVGRRWTDPQIHSPDKRYGVADLGPDGIAKFFATHQCNPVCKLLGLTCKNANAANAPVPKECVVCLDKPRDVVCRPCGHWCLCSGCYDAMQEKDANVECPLCKESLKEIIQINATDGLGTYVRDSVLDRAVKRRRLK